MGAIKNIFGGVVNSLTNVKNCGNSSQGASFGATSNISNSINTVEEINLSDSNSAEPPVEIASNVAPSMNLDNLAEGFENSGPPTSPGPARGAINSENMISTLIDLTEEENAAKEASLTGIEKFKKRSGKSILFDSQKTVEEHKKNNERFSRSILEGQAIDTQRNKPLKELLVNDTSSGIKNLQKKSADNFVTDSPVALKNGNSSIINSLKSK